MSDPKLEAAVITLQLALVEARDNLDRSIGRYIPDTMQRLNAALKLTGWKDDKRECVKQ